jgi:CBS domain-containing protein
MLRLALAHKPPVGFLRDFVVERSGEHRGRLDIKQRGLLPVTTIARYASLAAGAIGLGSAPERLSAAGSAGTLESNLARSLSEGSSSSTASASSTRSGRSSGGSTQMTISIRRI